MIHTMIKTLRYILGPILILTLLSKNYPVLAQSTTAFSGSLLTQISRSRSSTDTARLLFCQSDAGDRLSVYTVAQGVVSSGTTYRLTGSGDDLYLYVRSIDQQHTDSLHLAFNDTSFTMTINKQDRYLLFPNAYTRLKNNVQHKHQLTALIRLLNDAIGDYPIADALPLVRMQPQVSKQIRLANIITKRSQSDLTDNWVCNYIYGGTGLLNQVKVSVGNDIRYIKKVQYVSQKPVAVSTYLNLEYRQITEQKIRFFPGRPHLIRWQEDTYEPGKDRRTQTSVTLTKRDLGRLPGAEPSFDDVIRILRTKDQHMRAKTN